MIVDTSAVVALFRAEPAAAAIADTLFAAPSARMSAATFVELSIVLRADWSVLDLRRELEGIGIRIVEVDPTLAERAAEAYRVYGRGTGSPARLNFGDLFSYALAAASGEALLFVGDDFALTDITPALAPEAPGRDGD